MEGLIYVGKVMNKKIKKYTTKDWNEGIEHNIKLAVEWASLIIRVNETQFDKLEQGKIYIIPVWVRVFTWKDWEDQKCGSSWYARNAEITEQETWEIVYSPNSK